MAFTYNAGTHHWSHVDQGDPILNGNDLQACLNAAAAGDFIDCLANVEYRTNTAFKLAIHAGASMITIQSSAMASLPAPGIRVGNDAGTKALMPKITTNDSASGASACAIFTEQTGSNSAAYWTLQGLEIRPARYLIANDQMTFMLALIWLGHNNTGGPYSVPQSLDTQVPDQLAIKQCLIWSGGFYGPYTGSGNVSNQLPQQIQEGIALHSNNTTIRDCYIYDIHTRTTPEAQAIAQCNGAGPYQIINNYLEASGENLFFGGADQFVPLIQCGSKADPSDPLYPSGKYTTTLATGTTNITNNWIRKNPQWNPLDPTYQSVLPGGQGVRWNVKNLLEFKSGINANIQHNTLENCWVAADQQGYAILITPRGQNNKTGFKYFQGQPWTQAANLVISNNHILHTLSGFQVTGGDPGAVERAIDIRTVGATYQGNGTLRTHDITIQDNLWEDLFDYTRFGSNDGSNTGTTPTTTTFGTWMYVANGGLATPDSTNNPTGSGSILNLIINHNTHIATDIRGQTKFFVVDTLLGQFSHDGFQFTNNICHIGGYGCSGFNSSFANIAQDKQIFRPPDFSNPVVVKNNILYGKDLSQFPGVYTGGFLEGTGTSTDSNFYLTQAAGQALFTTFNPTGAGNYTIVNPPAGTPAYHGATDSPNNIGALTFTWASGGGGSTTVNSTTTMSASANPSSVGNAVTFTASVAGSGGIPTGTVQFANNGVNFGGAIPLVIGAMSSTAQSPAVSLGAGSYTITGSYSGDATFNSSVGTMTEVVGVSLTITELSSKNPSLVGDAVTFTAQIIGTGPVPTGLVQFAVDGVNLGIGVNLVNGMATTTTNALTAGTHTITASYSGDPNYTASQASIIQIVQIVTIGVEPVGGVMAPLTAALVFATPITNGFGPVITIPPKARTILGFVNAAHAPGGAGQKLDVWLQSSVDNGANWNDTAHVQLTGSGYAMLPISLVAPGPGVVPTKNDGTLAAGAIIQGPVGGILRAKYTVVIGTGTTDNWVFQVTADFL